MGRAVHSGVQGVQDLREQVIAVFLRYLDQADARMRPEGVGQRGIGFFLHDAENRHAAVKQPQNARGIHVCPALHTADLVHEDEIAVLCAIQRADAHGVKHGGEGRDAKPRTADADAVGRRADMILRMLGRAEQVDAPAAVGSGRVGYGAESAEPLWLELPLLSLP